MIRSLPAGYAQRAPTRDDLAAIVDLFQTCDLHDSGVVDYAEQDVLDDWNRPRFDLASRARIVTAEAGEIVVYVDVNDREDGGEVETGYVVHPDHRDRGLGPWALGWLLDRAGLLVDDPTAEVGVWTAIGAPLEEVAAAGFVEVRRFWRMARPLDGPVDVQPAPPGSTVRTLREGDERRMHAAHQEAFAEHWHFEPIGYERWWELRRARAGFDPSLWFLALDGEEIAAYVVAEERPDCSWIPTVGVRPKWRGRGLARHLLYLAFAELQRRGATEVALGVDAQNATGATRLYESVCMSVQAEFVYSTRTLADRPRKVRASSVTPR